MTEGDRYDLPWPSNPKASFGLLHHRVVVKVHSRDGYQAIFPVHPWLCCWRAQVVCRLCRAAANGPREPRAPLQDNLPISGHVDGLEDVGKTAAWLPSHPQGRGQRGESRTAIIINGTPGCLMALKTIRLFVKVQQG